MIHNIRNRSNDLSYSLLLLWVVLLSPTVHTYAFGLHNVNTYTSSTCECDCQVPFGCLKSSSNMSLDFQSRLGNNRERNDDNEEDYVEAAPNTSGTAKTLKYLSAETIAIPSIWNKNDNFSKSLEKYETQSLLPLSSLVPVFFIILLVGTIATCSTHATIALFSSTAGCITNNVFDAIQTDHVYRYIFDAITPLSLETFRKMIIMEFWRRAWGKAWQVMVKHWNTVWESIPSFCNDNKLFYSNYQCPTWISRLDEFLFGTIERGSKKLLEKGAEKTFWRTFNTIKKVTVSSLSWILFNISFSLHDDKKYTGETTFVKTSAYET